MDNDGGVTPKLINELINTICTINDIKEPEDLGANATQSQITEHEAALTTYRRQIELITLYIKAMCTNILIKTNRRMFIPELKYVVIDLVNDKLNNDKDAIQDMQSIQSMSEAGRSVNFGISNAIQSRLSLIAQKQLDDNEILIRRYRLLYKT